MTALDERLVLHLGSGLKYDPAAVNVDLTAATKPDVVHDLNARPWPFPDARFAEVRLHDVLEHLGDTVATLEEIHRVARPGALVSIIVPHFSSEGAYTDPTHRRLFGAFTFDYFVAGHPLAFYSRAKFRVRARRIVFRPTLANKVVWRLANRFPALWEQRWAWVFPAWFLHVELEVAKD